MYTSCFVLDRVIFRTEDELYYITYLYICYVYKRKMMIFDSVYILNLLYIHHI